MTETRCKFRRKLHNLRLIIELKHSFHYAFLSALETLFLSIFSFTISKSFHIKGGAKEMSTTSTLVIFSWYLEVRFVSLTLNGPSCFLENLKFERKDLLTQFSQFSSGSGACINL